jgi:hypothetical protein
LKTLVPVSLTYGTALKLQIFVKVSKVSYSGHNGIYLAQFAYIRSELFGFC